jgi:hypothetical protein
MVEQQAGSLGRGRRVRTPRQVADLAEHHALVAAASMTGAPTTYREAMRSSDSKEWERAMEAEMKALIETGALELVERPAAANVIDTRWVFKVKRDEHGEI